MAREMTIYRLNTGWLEASGGLSMFGEGRHPDVPGGQIRCTGWVNEIPRPDGSVGSGTWVPAPAWYIEGAGTRILVDTGTAPADEVLAWQSKYGVKQAIITEPRHDLVMQLEKLGVGASDIDVVIQTHLHLDHVGGAKRFPRARFVVHAAELPWALCPPPYGGFYYREFSHHTRAILDQIHFITADYQVAPGVRVVWTGGHSPGHCAVFVDTAVGQAVIAGDAVYNYRNLEFDWPQGPIFDLGQAARAIQIVKSADVILVDHDSLFDELFPSGIVGNEDLASETKAYMERIRTAGAFSLSTYSEAWPRPVNARLARSMEAQT